MRVLKLSNLLTNEDIRHNLDIQKNIKDYKNWQIICALAFNPHKDAEEIASMLCIKRNLVYRVVAKYNKYGKDFNSIDKRGGFRKENAFLSREEESTFFQSLEKDAVDGKILTYRDIKKIIEEKLNREVSDDYIWNLFKRNEWTKKSPRPYHPLNDKNKVEEFKKNSKKIWLPKN